MAGSVRPGDEEGGSSTSRSFMSLARKMMYSYTSFRGATGLSVTRSSVPKDRTDLHRKEKCQHVHVRVGEEQELPFASAIVDSFVSIVYRMPSYRISDLEMREILQPMNEALMSLLPLGQVRGKE